MSQRTAGDSTTLQCLAEYGHLERRTGRRGDCISAELGTSYVMGREVQGRTSYLPTTMRRDRFDVRAAHSRARELADEIETLFEEGTGSRSR